MTSNEERLLEACKAALPILEGLMKTLEAEEMKDYEGDPFSVDAFFDNDVLYKLRDAIAESEKANK